jgi:hypothetical protein
MIIIMNCKKIKITKNIIDDVSKYSTSEELLRNGGVSIEALDEAAFGFSEKSVKKLNPNQLNIRWFNDLENVKYEIKQSNMLPVDWAKRISLDEPIDVDYWEDGDLGFKRGFYIQDGHHRFYAAKILNKLLNVDLTIKVNPILVLGDGLSYDDFHRCVFNQVEELNSEKNKKLMMLKQIRKF